MDAYSVLAIDNEAYALIWLQNAFHRPDLGFSCTRTASNAMEALDIIHTELPDLIVSDIRMPQMNGIELLHRLREENIPSIVVLVSAYADFSYAQNALREGALDYLLKPVSDTEVTAVLQKAREQLQEMHALTPESTSEEEAEKPDGDLRELIVSYLQKNYDKPIRLPDLANAVHLNTNYCGSLFQKFFNTTFTRYLNDLRIEKAMEFLSRKNLSVSLVAKLVGYSDVFYFSKVFKQHTGKAPSEYRSGQALTEGGLPGDEKNS